MRRKSLFSVVVLLIMAYILSISVLANDNTEVVEDCLTDESIDINWREETIFRNSYEGDSVLSQNSTSVVYTPNGTAVPVVLYEESENIEDISVEYDGMILSNYDSVSLIYRSSYLFNCHSYAWYSQMYQTNIYNLENPGYYIVDGSYRITATPQPGDIIVYSNSKNSFLHSGIVVEVLEGESNGVCDDSNLVIVQSKWGWNGLYEHRGDICIYTTAAHDYEQLTQSQREHYIAEEVTYFHRADHTHTFAKTDYNSDWHKKYCTGCGVTIWEEHSYTSLSSKNSTSHYVTCACGDSITQSHSFDYEPYSENVHKKHCDCGYATYVAHNYEYSYTNAQTHTKTCTLCDASYQDPHYEDVYSVEDNGDGTHDIMCICQGIFDEAADHVHNEYGYYDGVYHMISCICGDYELEAHELEYSSLDDTYHWEACEICGYENEVEHSYTASNTYYDLNHHKAFCDCGAYEITLHDEYTVKSYTTSLHTLQLTCCGTRTVTNWHTYEDYDSDSHTGDCVFCNHTLTTDQAHTDGNYMDNGNGTHTNKCNYCDYSHTEYHVYTCFALDEETHQRYCQKCDLDQVVEEHIFVDEYDENGWYLYCTGCQYKIYMDELTADMIAKLPVEIQTAMQSAPQNAQLNAQPDGDIYYVIRIDDENGILYLNGEYYLLRYPEIPDAETEPIVPSEESIS